MIYHLAKAEDWDAALQSGEYRISTLGRTLDDVGFIHASTAEQLPGVAEAFYRDEPAQLVVLGIEEPGLDVRWEDIGNGEMYPHIYSPIRPTDVVEVVPAWFEDDGGFALER